MERVFVKLVVGLKGSFTQGEAMREREGEKLMTQQVTCSNS